MYDIKNIIKYVSSNLQPFSQIRDELSLTDSRGFATFQREESRIGDLTQQQQQLQYLPVLSREKNQEERGAKKSLQV